MSKNNTNNNTSRLAWIFPILFVLGLIILIVSIKIGKMRVFIERTQHVTIDRIQKDYDGLGPSIKSANAPVVVGDYEITGTAKSSLVTPFSKTPCIYYSYRFTQIYEEKEKDYTDHWVWKKKEHPASIEENAIPFDLNDGTGVLRINPENAKYIGRLDEKDEEVNTSSNHHYSDQRDIAERHQESYMPVDIPITVLGTVYAQNGNLFMKRKPSSYLIVSRHDHESIINGLEGAGKSRWLGILFIILGGIPSFIWIVLVIRRRKS